jgi:hypothetical protein
VAASRRWLTAGLVAFALAVPALAAAQAEPPPAKPRFVRDVFDDYRNFISLENFQWLAIGGIGTLIVAEADEAVRAATQDPGEPVTRALDAGEVGATYGNLTLQVPLAIGWWVVSHATDHERGAAAGRDLMRAQISALSWTYAIKYAVNRTRPNGDPRSFPSGHSSAAFATAMVLHQHYGWKVGVPIFAAATYTAASRLTVNKHWASDVAFGAVLGMISARTATLHVRRTPVIVAPMILDGGAGIRFRLIY